MSSRCPGVKKGTTLTNSRLSWLLTSMLHRNLRKHSKRSTKGLQPRLNCNGVRRLAAKKLQIRQVKVESPVRKIWLVKAGPPVKRIRPAKAGPPVKRIWPVKAGHLVKRIRPAKAGPSVKRIRPAKAGSQVKRIVLNSEVIRSFD